MTHLHLMATFFVDLLLGLFPLFGRLDFTSHLHDLYLSQRACETLVERELVGRADFSAFGEFGQDSEFTTGERL